MTVKVCETENPLDPAGPAAQIRRCRRKRRPGEGYDPRRRGEVKTASSASREAKRSSRGISSPSRRRRDCGERVRDAGMQITRLELKDFRNIREAAVSFCPGVNVICGENAQGKTNLLEAVALLTGRGSFRGARESQMTRFGGEGVPPEDGLPGRRAGTEYRLRRRGRQAEGGPQPGAAPIGVGACGGCSRRWSSTRRTSRW